MLSRFFLVLFLFVLLENCSQEPKNICNQNIEDEDYNVSSIVIESIIASTNSVLEKDKRNLLIINENSLSEVTKPTGKISDMLKEENLYASYIDRNSEAHKFERKFNLNKEYLIFSTQDWEKLEKEKIDVYDLPKSNPNFFGSFVLSRVGFNSSMTKAAVFVAMSCGIGCGEGSMFFLVKDNESCKWTIENKILTTIM